jgi:hypothetical protein
MRMFGNFPRRKNLNLTFSDIVQLLHKYMTGNFKTQADFLEHLLRNSFNEEASAIDPFTDSPYNLNEEKLSRAYSGKGKVVLAQRTVRFFVSNFEENKLAEYIDYRLNGEQLDDLDSAIDDSQYKFEDINTSKKYAKAIYQSLKNIINKKSNKKTIKSANKPDDLMATYGNTLFVESKSKCPNHGCSKFLYKKVHDQIKNDFEITIIDTSNSHTVENLIALCHDCNFHYQFNYSPEIVSQMKDIKQKLTHSFETIDVVKDNKIQLEIERVVRKIATLPMSTTIDLNYNPLFLQKKIPNDIILRQKVHSYVSTWFTDIKDIFKNVSSEGSLHYHSLCSEIKTAWLNLDSENLTQYEIFTALTDWIASKINDRKDLCEIVVSYFIQECEVFEDATAK